MSANRMRNWINLFETFEELTHLYHVTPRSNLESIKHNGLNPAHSKWSDAVYLAGDSLHAMGYIGHHKNDDCVLLVININDIDENKLHPDDVDLPDSLGDPDEWENFDWKESIQICGQCRYDGTIPPEAIEVREI